MRKKIYCFESFWICWPGQVSWFHVLGNWPAAFCSVAQLFLSMSGEAPPPCVSCKRWPCNSGGGACRICASAFELIRIAQGASFTSGDFRDLSSQLSFLVGEFVIRGGGPKSGGEPLAFDKSPEGSERPRGEHTPQRIDRPQSPVHQGGLDREGRSLPLAGRGRNSPRRSSPVRKEESRSSRRIRSSDNSDKDEAHRERHRRRRRRSSKEETDSDLELRDRPSETDSRKPDKSWVPSLRPRVDFLLSLRRSQRQLAWIRSWSLRQAESTYSSQIPSFFRQERETSVAPESFSFFPFWKVS